MYTVRNLYQNNYPVAVTVTLKNDRSTCLAPKLWKVGGIVASAIANRGRVDSYETRTHIPKPSNCDSKWLIEKCLTRRCSQLFVKRRRLDKRLSYTQPYFLSEPWKGHKKALVVRRYSWKTLWINEGSGKLVPCTPSSKVVILVYASEPWKHCGTALGHQRLITTSLCFRVVENQQKAEFDSFL